MERKTICGTLLTIILCMVGSVAWATTTWYVNGVSGSDSNDCTSATTACKTIAHAISLAASGDSILVAAATYKENLTIGLSLSILGASAATTIIDGGGVATVVTISSPGACHSFKADGHQWLCKLQTSVWGRHFQLRYIETQRQHRDRQQSRRWRGDCQSGNADSQQHHR